MFYGLLPMKVFQPCQTGKRSQGRPRTSYNVGKPRCFSQMVPNLMHLSVQSWGCGLHQWKTNPLCQGMLGQLTAIAGSMLTGGHQMLKTRFNSSISWLANYFLLNSKKHCLITLNWICHITWHGMTKKHLNIRLKEYVSHFNYRMCLKVKCLW